LPVDSSEPEPNTQVQSAVDEPPAKIPQEEAKQSKLVEAPKKVEKAVQPVKKVVEKPEAKKAAPKNETKKVEAVKKPVAAKKAPEQPKIDLVQADMKQEKELQNELSKISENVNSTLTSLEAHESHVAELTDMIFSQNDGPVKSELLKVLTNANKHVSELQDHIKEGKELVKTKET
jgi:outer membrane biosynthesis protein TonB